MSESRFDIEIEGSGVAASVAAALLSRAGLKVVQHVEAQRPYSAPAEILGPRARMLLQELGIREPASSATYCDGVMSAWCGAPIDWYDYRLLFAIPGLAVDRRAWHAHLQRTASDAGATLIHSDRRGAARYHRGKIRLVASGRSAIANRGESDRLIALFMPCAGIGSARLLVESVSDGWLYIPPPVAGEQFVVCVTRPTLVPRGLDARKEWLLDLIGGTQLISEAVGCIDFSRLRGVDARVGWSAMNNDTNEVLMGDAAASHDPLSGTGIMRAIEGASLIARSIVARGSPGPEYFDWLHTVHATDRALRIQFYAQAARHFSQSTFWGQQGLVDIHGLRGHPLPP
ncbi:hypothetical protein C7S18_09520 [Ahniella affigens]|uniref:FAD-binding domain-containing protein n=1 Tax=Ahniella affigens TaxID=2021234 RepID=A0A2P1PRG4_9GAMM|nr:hypothetical protein C7S18_09520 [Ahniella affigens]